MSVKIFDAVATRGGNNYRVYSLYNLKAGQNLISPDELNGIEQSKQFESHCTSNAVMKKLK